MAETVAVAAVVTLAASVLFAAILFGTKWGQLVADVKHIKRDVDEIRDTFILAPRKELTHVRVA